MTDDEIDRILSRGGEIAPSSGFADSVMEAVRLDAATPPPIPFPWKRALPGLAAGCTLVIAMAATLTGDPAQSASLSLPSDFWTAALADLGKDPETIWALVATLVTLATLGLSLRLTDNR